MIRADDGRSLAKSLQQGCNFTVDEFETRGLPSSALHDIIVCGSVGSSRVPQVNSYSIALHDLSR